ncbi:MAG: hypothetical protein ACFFDP_12085 [Promethearchaeota archaeon]
MSHRYILELQEKIIDALENLEEELPRLGVIHTQEELQTLVEKVEQLRAVLDEVKKYFIEVRSKLTDVRGIPPAKELAQIVIGTVTEALSAIRETLLHLEEYKVALRGKRRKPKTLEELHYADSSAKEAVRATRQIMKRIEEHTEELKE